MCLFLEGLGSGREKAASVATVGERHQWPQSEGGVTSNTNEDIEACTERHGTPGSWVPEEKNQTAHAIQDEIMGRRPRLVLFERGVET